MDVTILGREKFKEKVLPNIGKEEDCFYICILEPDDNTPLSPNQDNFLTLDFYDLEYDMDNGAGVTYKSISDEQAKQLFEFIKSNSDKKKLYVSCAAGISRSGAVGAFVWEYFGGAYKELLKKHPHILPNGRVLRLLRMYDRLDNMGDLKIKF